MKQKRYRVGLLLVTNWSRAELLRMIWVEIMCWFLRIVVFDAVRKEFGLCNNSMNFRCVLPCVGVVWLYGDCRVCNMLLEWVVSNNVWITTAWFSNKVKRENKKVSWTVNQISSVANLIREPISSLPVFHLTLA